MFQKATAKIVAYVLTIVVLGFSLSAVAQSQTTDPRVEELERKVEMLERSLGATSSTVQKLKAAAPWAGPLLFLFAAFCALWAQNSGRNSFFWFFVGALFNVLAVIAVLMLNGSEKSRGNKL